MTAQAKELLMLDGKPEWMQTLPLEPYLDAHAIDMEALVDCWSTGLYRRYQAAWEVADEHLFFIGMVDAGSCRIDPALVFDERQLPVAADWFTGRIQVGRGEVLSYHHMGWGAEYASLLRLYFQEGRLVARRSYDQTWLLRRRFDRFVASDPDWHEHLVEHSKRTLQPIGGLTAAGLRALCRPELVDEGLLSTWTADALTAEESEQLASYVLRHCVRVPDRDRDEAVAQPPAR